MLVRSQTQMRRLTGDRRQAQLCRTLSEEGRKRAVRVTHLAEGKIWCLTSDLDRITTIGEDECGVGSNEEPSVATFEATQVASVGRRTYE